MDLNFVEVKLQETKKELAHVLADEIIGFDLQEPEFKLIFNSSLLDYTPGVVVEAVSKNEVRYLVYSPLLGMMNALNEGTFIDISEIGKAYHHGSLNAEVIGDSNEIGLILYQNRVEGNICRSAEQAEELIKAFVAMTDSRRRIAFYGNCGKKNIRENIFAASINDVLFWFLFQDTHYGFCSGFMVNVANSIVSYQGICQEDIQKLDTGCRYESKAYKACPSRRYLYNGKTFSAVRDNSRFLTAEEAGGCYENMPEKDKMPYVGYKERGFVPVMCLNEFYYLIAESHEDNAQKVLLMNALDGEVSRFDYNVSENVRYIQVGAYFENEGAPVLLSEKGWESK